MLAADYDLGIVLSRQGSHCIREAYSRVTKRIVIILVDEATGDIDGPFSSVLDAEQCAEATGHCPVVCHFCRGTGLDDHADSGMYRLACSICDGSGVGTVI